MTAPGRRDDDAHTLGFRCADALVGAWPDAFTPDLLPGLAASTVNRFLGVGAVSRFSPAPP